MKKKSGMRNGCAHATMVPIQLVSPTSFSTPRVECIITTNRMQTPLATSTQSTRPSGVVNRAGRAADGAAVLAVEPDKRIADFFHVSVLLAKTLK